MKNEITYKIPQKNIMEFLGLDTVKFQELKRVFNINTVEPLTYNQLKGLIAYLSRLGETQIVLEKLDLKSFEVDGETEIKTETLPLPKKIREPNKKETPVQTKVITTMTKAKKLTCFKNHKEAAKAYNQNLLNVYYSLKPTLLIEKCTKFDTTRTFNFLIKDLKTKYPKMKLYLYTDNSTYEKQKKKILTKKARIWTKEEDEKILNYYNSDFYKNAYSTKSKNHYTTADLAKEVNADRKTLSIRASELGFVNFKRPKENEYSKEEIELLRKHSGEKTSSQIQVILKDLGFTRSRTSINIKLTRLKLDIRLSGAGDLSLRLISSALGIDHKGIDKNDKFMNFMQPQRQDGQLLFCREKLRTYIMQNPYEFNFGKVDNKFLIEILTQEKL